MTHQSFDTEIRKERTAIHKLLADNELALIAHQCSKVRSTAQIPVNRYFDHTILKPETVFQQIEDLCRESLALNVRSVCIPQNRIVQAGVILKGSDVAVCSVVGFPHGYTSTAAKVADTCYLRDNGCDEFDMVIQIGALIDDDLISVYQDIRAVTECVPSKIVKVILETAYLTPRQIIRGGIVAAAAGAAMLKSSTGFAPAGATLQQIALLRAIAGENIGVKAAGGIRSWELAHACIAAGADRLGTSQTTAILAEAPS